MASRGSSPKSTKTYGSVSGAVSASDPLERRGMLHPFAVALGSGISPRNADHRDSHLFYCAKYARSPRDIAPNKRWAQCSAQSLGSSHWPRPSRWCSSPNLTVIGIPYRRFSHGRGWDPHCYSRAKASGPVLDASRTSNRLPSRSPSSRAGLNAIGSGEPALSCRQDKSIPVVQVRVALPGGQRR